MMVGIKNNPNCVAMEHFVKMPCDFNYAVIIIEVLYFRFPLPTEKIEWQ